MTLAEGAELTVPAESKLVVGGITGSCNGGNDTGFGGQTVGDHSNINLASSSAIIVENGGILSCTGYIIGSGTIEVQPGGDVYEPFIVCEFRGGTYMAVAAKTNKVTPFNSYTMLNIQAPLTIESGGELYGYCDLISSGTSHNKTTARVIGTENAIINLSESARLTATYNPCLLYTSDAADD